MKLLLVDDDDCLCETLREIIPSNADFPVEIETAADGYEALRLYREHGPYSLVLTDWKHEGPDGLELAELIHEINPAQPIGLMTACSLASVPELRIKEFAFFLQKPFDGGELMGLIRDAASRPRIIEKRS